MSQKTLFSDPANSAVLSDCGRYRYQLSRVVGPLSFAQSRCEKRADSSAFIIRTTRHREVGSSQWRCSIWIDFAP
jgi:hypothetical protein